MFSKFALLGPVAPTPIKFEPSSSWSNTKWLELGSNLRSKMNPVQLIRDLIIVGVVGP